MSTTRPTDAEAQLLALRQRLRAARAERGSCPPWEELRDDLLPGGKERAGRDDRLAHKELCPYCSERVKEWEKSFDHASDTLGALEKGMARGVVAGAKMIASIGRRDGSTAPEPVAAPPETAAPVIAPPPVAKPTPPPPRDAPPSMIATPRPAPVRPAPPPPPPPTKSVATPKRERPAPRPAERPAAPSAPAPSPSAAAPASPAKEKGPLRLLVVEAAHESHVPESVHLCAAVLGAEVACVQRIEDLAGDPDLDAVCAIVLAAARPDESWPEVVRRARDLAPSRPVVVLAPYGVEVSGSARRALGGRLLSMSDSAERLLVALDARLR